MPSSSITSGPPESLRKQNLSPVQFFSSEVYDKPETSILMYIFAPRANNIVADNFTSVNARTFGISNDVHDYEVQVLRNVFSFVGLSAESRNRCILIEIRCWYLRFPWQSDGCNVGAEGDRRGKLHERYVLQIILYQLGFKSELWCWGLASQCLIPKCLKSGISEIRIF